MTSRPSGSPRRSLQVGQCRAVSGVDMLVGELTGRNTLDTTTTCKTSDSRLGDTLDVVTQNLSVTLGTALAEALAALAA